MANEGVQAGKHVASVATGQAMGIASEAGHQAKELFAEAKSELMSRRPASSSGSPTSSTVSANSWARWRASPSRTDWPPASLSQAAEWAQDRGVSATDHAEYISEFDHLTLVRLLIARHRAHPETGSLDQAVGLLARLHEAAQTSGRAGSLVEIRILLALAYDGQGDRPQALQSLCQAWAQAPEPAAYVRLFLDEGAPMVELLRDAEHDDLAGDQAHRLLSLNAARDNEASDSGQPRARSLLLQLSERELQVLRLLDSELSGPQIARELFVSHNTLRTHTKHIFTKLEVTTRRAAVRRARERGLM